MAEGRRGPASFTWEFRAPFRNAPNDLALATYVDINGDGFGDAIFSAGYLERQGAYVYLGGPNGLGPRHIQFFPLVVGGMDMDDIGDLNGDGFSDVILMDFHPNTERPDDHRIYLGSPGGLIRTDRVLGGPAVNGRLINANVTSLGDINLDGYADVSSVSDLARPENPFLPLRSWVHLGSAEGYQPQGLVEIPRPDPMSAQYLRVHPLGDFNGDSRSDYLLCQASDGDILTHCYQTEAQNISIPSRWRRLNAPAGFGFDIQRTWSLRSCDLNGDGSSEIPLVFSAGAHTYRPRIAVYQHRAGTDALSPASIIEFQTMFPPEYGRNVDLRCAGDMDGNGYDDLVANYHASIGPVNAALRSGPGGVLDIYRFGPETEGVSISPTFHAGNDLNGDARADCVFVDRSQVASAYTVVPGATRLTEQARIPSPIPSESDGSVLRPFGLAFLF